MTAPRPSSPDPEHSHRSVRPFAGRDGRQDGGRQGSHRRGDPAGGASGAHGSSAGPSGSGDGDFNAYRHGRHGSDAYGSGGDSGAGAYGSGPHGPESYGSESYGSESYGSESYGSESYGSEPYGDAGGFHDGRGPAAPDGTAPPYGYEVPRTDVRREVRDGALCALPVLVLGVALGLLWLWLAPRVPLVSVDGGVFLKDPEGEEAIGADGTFMLLAAGLGVVTGLAAFLRNRAGGVGIVVGLAVGALLGSVLAWQLGVVLGPSSDLAASAKAAGANKTFDGPLKLQAKGALLVWPFLALLTHLALMGAFGRRDPEPAPLLPAPPEDGGTGQHR